MRRRAGVALVAVVALLLTACSGIPRDGAVEAGQTLPPDAAPAPVFLPSSPQDDAGIESILGGFIDAASSPDSNYAIAREYLTPAFSDGWNPEAGVTVDDGTERTSIIVDSQTMQFSVNPIAEVDADGQYREVESSAPVLLQYAFTQVDGQWRISQAPNGTVIDEATFRDVFSSQALYFFDPGFGWLIPDLRWFVRGASAPTKIVRAVLTGPSAWLSGAVTTAFPEGTALTADAVRVDGRVAQVDLNSAALSADQVTLRRMKAQLTASLPTGMGVEITINQNSQQISGLGDEAPVLNPRVDARALVLRGGEFGLLAAGGATLTPIPGISDTVERLGATAVTLAAGHELAAVRNTDGVYSVSAGEEPQLLDSRPDLLAPSVDNSGFVWTVPTGAPAQIAVHSRSGGAVTLTAPWPEAVTIHALKVSRDGARLIALLRTETETRFVTAAIERSDSVPTGIGPTLLLRSDAGTPLDATWIDELTVASLNTLPSGAERIVTQRIGGESSVLQSPADGVVIVGSNSVRDLRALTSKGALTVQRGVGWQERLDGVDVLATQQGLSD
ncbi:MAG: LpqB family beta-propeller domain-containing protein [Cryobacterium sp.]